MELTMGQRGRGCGGKYERMSTKSCWLSLVARWRCGAAPGDEGVVRSVRGWRRRTSTVAKTSALYTLSVFSPGPSYHNKPRITVLKSAFQPHSFLSGILWRAEVTAMIYVVGLGIPVIEARDLTLPTRQKNNATVHVMAATRRRAAVFRFGSSLKASQPAVVRAFIDCATAAQSKWRVHTSGAAKPPRLTQLSNMADVVTFLTASRRLTGRSLRGRFFSKPSQAR